MHIIIYCLGINVLEVTRQIKVNIIMIISYIKCSGKTDVALIVIVP